MPRVVPVTAFLTMKGGVGKTTLAANVTRAIADVEKRKILLVDTDAQCNLTQIFAEPAEIDRKSVRSIYQAFDGHQPYSPGDLKHPIYTNRRNGSTIDLIFGSFETFTLSVAATPTVRERAAARFKHFMQQAREAYDLIVLDTNPSATFTTMEALEVSNFLVAPITFDGFSMRGIHLITHTLKDRYPWLRNARQIRVLPNRVPRTYNDRDMERLQEEEQRVRDAFEYLRPSIAGNRIHESRFLSNKLPKRGFVIDHRVLPLNVSRLRVVAQEFDAVARELLLAFKEAFGDEARDNQTTFSAVRNKLEEDGDRPMV